MVARCGKIESLEIASSFRHCEKVESTSEMAIITLIGETLGWGK
jgi:hypothetical protein